MLRPRRHHPDQPHGPSGWHSRWSWGEPRRTRRRTSAGLAVTAILVAVISGCSDGADLDPGPNSPARIATTPTPTPNPTPTAGDPIITIAPSAEKFTNDPAVTTFRTFVDVVTRLMRSAGEDRGGLTDITTGEAFRILDTQAAELAAKGRHLAGTPRWVVTGIREVNAAHRHILSCEYDSAAYAVDDATGKPVFPVQNVWKAKEQWLVLADGRWKIEDLYSGKFSCQEAER